MATATPWISKSLRIVVTISLLASQAARVGAHEHHDDKIPEGGAVSPDPLVCSFDLVKKWQYLTSP
jgi:hypothetical protein